MKTLIVLILLVVVAAGAYWYVASDKQKEQVRRAEDQAAQRTQAITETVKQKLKDVSLSGEDIKKELERTGKVVRKKAEKLGSAIADATADARITATIKAKLVKDPNLSALKISVNTTDGVVTLAGSADSAEAVSQAMKLALETEGTREVISTLQIKARP